jgi:thermitase
MKALSRLKPLLNHNFLLMLVLSMLPLTTVAAPEIPVKLTDDSQTFFVRGQILVQPRAGLSEKEFDNILRPQNGKRIGKLQNINVHIVSVPSNTELAVMNALSKNKHIGFAELNTYVQPTRILNDSNIGSAWHLAKIGAPSAWDYVNGTGVVVADCDTGVDSDHPDLMANLQANLGWNTSSNNNIWEDINGHGTATSGAMAAVGDNKIGAAGVAYNSPVIPVRVTNSSDGSATLSALANCVTYAADKGARGANLSYSGVCGSSTIFSAAAYMRNKTGGVVVAAAANTGREIAYANDANITCVSATDSADNLASWSSYGNYVDVAAPGVSIYLATMGGGYGFANGTSFSSPITMGVYALMMQANPSLTPSQLDEILFSTTQDLGATGWDKYYGHGRIDAARAVLKASTFNIQDSIAPAVSITSPAADSQVAGTVLVDVSATDNVGVSKVRLKANGITYEDNSAPYQFSIDTAGMADGPLVLEASALDEQGNIGSSSITVYVQNDNVKPLVAFTNPTNGATVKGTITVSANASDDKKLSKVTLAIDGKVVHTHYSSSTSTTLNYSWRVCPNLKSCSGNSTLTAVAYDAANNSQSTSITVKKTK